MPGRVYLSENFCCFYSGFLGKTVNLVLDFKCITKISKVSSTWKNKSIKIIYKNKKKKSSDDNNKSMNEKELSFRFYGF